MKGLENELCPRCGAGKLISWKDLSDDEKFLAERLPASAEYTPAERKKHRFCTRCWNEEAMDEHRLA